MKTLLIHTSPFITHRAWNYLEHLGIGFLEKALINEGFGVDVFDATMDWSDTDAVIEKVMPLSSPYAVLGFSVNRSNFRSALEAVRLVREMGYRGHITLGGYFPTFHYEKILARFPEIDSIIVGHGEYSLVSLCHNIANGIPAEETPGLAYRNGPDGVAIQPCLDSDDYIRSIGIPVHRPRYGVARMILSRGCEYGCAFCCVHAFDRYNLRTRYLRRDLYEVLDEIELLIKQYDVNHIWFSDMDFVGKNHDFIYQFCEEVVKRRYGITFEGDCRIDYIEKDLVETLAVAGFNCVFVGVESFAKRQITDYGKFSSSFDEQTQVLEKTKLLREHNIIPRFGFIMFDKDTTFEEVVLNHDIIHNTVGYGTLDGLANKIAVLPGTRLEKMYLEDPDYCRVVEITGENEMEPYLYYPQYSFKDPRVGFVYEIAFSYRNKFHRLQELFDKQLREGKIPYSFHCTSLWRMRDLFGDIFERVLRFIQESATPYHFDSVFRRRLDEILVGFFLEKGFAREEVVNLLEEEHQQPGERYP